MKLVIVATVSNEAGSNKANARMSNTMMMLTMMMMMTITINEVDDDVSLVFSFRRAARDIIAKTCTSSRQDPGD